MTSAARQTTEITEGLPSGRHDQEAPETLLDGPPANHDALGTESPAANTDRERPRPRGRTQTRPVYRLTYDPPVETPAEDLESLLDVLTRLAE